MKTLIKIKNMIILQKDQPWKGCYIFELTTFQKIL